MAQRHMVPADAANNVSNHKVNNEAAHTYVQQLVQLLRIGHTTGEQRVNGELACHAAVRLYSTAMCKANALL